MNYPFAKFELVLCSASPRRQLLLSEAGLKFRVLINNADESFPEHLEGSDIARFLAEKKADSIEEEKKLNTIYITADTIVWHNQAVLNKPADRAEAISMLTRLAGNQHQVFTGICLSSGNRRKTFTVESKVWFFELTTKEIIDYVDHYEPFDKAGAYGAQECLPEGVNPCSDEEMEFMTKHEIPDLFASSLAMDTRKHVPVIKQISGSYFNVMGLPLVELWKELENFS